MKNKYIAPEIEIVRFEAEDIITTSGEAGENSTDLNATPSVK